MCLGPFETDPSNLRVFLKTRDFLKPDLFKPIKDGEKHILKTYLQSKQNKKHFYILLLFQSEIVVCDDICISVKSNNSNGIAPLDFRFWLNAGYLTKDTKIFNFQDVNDINVCDFVPIDHPNYSEMTDHEAFLSVLEETKNFKTCDEISDTLRLFIKRFSKNQNKIKNAKDLTGQILQTEYGN